MNRALQFMHKGSLKITLTVPLIEADVVLALGTRLGPFGSLPQYGFDYWPKSAKIIQVTILIRLTILTI